MAEFHPFMAAKRAKPEDSEPMLILRELTDLYTPAGKIGSPEDVLRRAKETKNWTVRSAIEFFKEVVGVMRDEQMPQLLQNIVLNMELNDVYEFLAVLADNEFREMVALMANTREGENDDAPSEFSTIFGPAPAGLEKLVKLLNVWKTRNALEGERMADMLADMCMGWFPDVTTDPNLSIFLNLLIKNGFTVTDVLATLSKLYEEDAANGAHWEDEEETFAFFKDLCGGWNADQKKTLLQALPIWGWKIADWDKAYEALYNKKFDPKADPALRDTVASLRGQAPPPGAGGKKKNKKKNKKKAAAAAAAPPPQPKQKAGARGAGPSFPAFKSAAPTSRLDDDEEEFEDEEDFGDDPVEEMIYRMGGDHSEAPTMENMIRMMAQMGMAGPAGMHPMFGGFGGSDEDEDVSDEDLPPLQPQPQPPKSRGGGAPRGGGSGAPRGGSGGKKPAGRGGKRR